MSRNKLKKAQSYFETCLVRVSLRSVFRKPAGKIFDDFGVISRPIFEQIWPWRDPGRVPGTTLGHLWTQNSKKYLKSTKTTFLWTSFWRPFFIKFSLFFIGIWNYVWGNPPNNFLKGLLGHFETISGVVFQAFWRHWKPWKMLPLPCKTSVFQYPEARLFIIFPHIFQDRF